MIRKINKKHNWKELSFAKKYIRKEEKLFKKYRAFLEGLSSMKYFKVTKSVINNHLFSKGILTRMYYFYKAQDIYCKEINRFIKYSASDYFEDTIALYLGSFLGSKYKVFIGKSFKFDSKKQYRPDIIVFRKEKPIFILEVKTQLGWNRTNWKKDFENRRNAMAKSFKLQKEKIKMVVLTAANWNVDLKKVPKYVKILSKLWPYNEHDNKLLEKLLDRENFVNFIEELFREIKNIKINR